MKRLAAILLVCCLLAAAAPTAHAECGYFIASGTYYGGGSSQGSYWESYCYNTTHETRYRYDSSKKQHAVQLKHDGYRVDGAHGFVDYSKYETLRYEDCLPVTVAGTPATCTEAGKTDGLKCALCGHVEIKQERIPPTGHTTVTDSAVEPTCTAPGKTIGQHCSACGEVTLAQTEVPAAGHSMQSSDAVPATCTTPGRSAGSVCATCGHTEGATEIPATGHSEVADGNGVAATCTASGLAESKHCTACGVTTVPQNEIPATGHSEVADGNGVAATCTASGLTESKHCATCGVTTVPQNEIPATGHSEVVDAGKDATCTDSGLTEGKHCATCGVTTVPQREIPAMGHSEVVDAGKDATCTDSGLTEGKHCATCGVTTVPQSEITAKSHAFWGEWSMRYNDKHARYCSRGCGQHISAPCQPYTAAVGEAVLSICPICGRWGEAEAALQEDAAIANPAAKKPGNFIARAALNPVADNADCIAVITLVYERNGAVVDLATDAEAVTVTLQMLSDVPCQLVFVTVDELTQEPVWTPVEYAVEDGKIVFSVNQLGLFLLMAE